MKSFSLLLATAILATAAFAQDTTVKVSYSSVATRLPKVLDALSEASKVKLQAAPDMAGEIVMVRVKDVTLQSVMDRIAEATSGRWEPDGAGFKLVADISMRRQEEQVVQTEYMRKLAKELNDKAEPLRKTPQLTRANIEAYLKPPSPPTGKKNAGNDDDEDDAGFDMSNIMGFNTPDPTDRLIIRLAMSIGANSLATVKPGDRVVYSTNPNSSQLGVGGGAGAVNLFVQEQNVYVEKLGKPEVPVIDDAENPMAGLMKQFMPRETSRQPVKEMPAKVLLIVKRNALMGGLQLNVNLYDAQGNITFVGTDQLGDGGGMFGGMAAVRAVETSAVGAGEKTGTGQTKPPADPTEIKLSDRTKKLSALNGRFSDPAGMDQKIPDDVKEMLLHPEDNDPLSFAPSDALTTLADKRNMPLVADLPDNMISYMEIFAGGEKRTLGQFLESLKSEKTGVITEKEGFLVFKPADPSGARSQRVDRPSLGKLLRASHDNGGVTLDEMADYAAINPSPMSTPAAMVSLSFFAPEVAQGGMGAPMDWDLLRFYGLLAPSMRTALVNGTPLPFSQLSAVQRKAVERIVFGPQHGLEVITGKPKDKDDMMDLFTRGMSGIMNNENGTSYKTEPTEVMPNRLPPQGVLTVVATKEPMAKLGGDGVMGNFPLGLNELALFKFFKEDPKMSAVGGSMPNMDSLKLGTRTILAFHFRVARDVEAEHSLQDNLVPKDAKPVNYASLPEDFRKKIEDRMAAMKKLPFFDPSFFPGSQQQVPPQ